MKFIKLFFAVVIFIATQNIVYAQSSNALPKFEEVKTIEVKVKGVGCAADVKSIAESVEKLDGVSRCKTIKKGATTKFEVYLLPSVVSQEAIYAAIEDTPGCKNPNDRPYKVKE